MNMGKKQVMYLLVIILLLGTFLRFYQLDKESFWLDEGATGLVVKKYNSAEIINNIREHGQMLPGYYHYDDDLPLYYVILRGWSDIFGFNDFSLRAFSAFLGSLALFAVFYLVKYLFDDKTALLVMFLSSINLTLILYSQEARQYSYLLFLSLLSVIFLLKSLKEGKTMHVASFLAVSPFIIFTHFPWAMFFTFEGAYALYIMYNDYKNKKKVHTKILAAFVIIGLLYLTIIGRALFSVTDTVTLYGKPNFRQFAEFGMRLSTWVYPSESMRQKIYDSLYNFSLFEWFLLVSVALSAVFLSLMFLYGIKKSLYKKQSAVFLLFMFFMPFLFAITLSLIHPRFNVFHIKQVIYIIPIFLIFASIGMLRAKFRRTLIAMTIILSILPLYAYYANIDKQQVREAAKFLPNDEPIFLSIDTAQVVFKYYYGEKNNVAGVKNVDELKSHLKNKSSFWMLLTFTKYSDSDGEIEKFLDSNYRLVEKKGFFDIELLHYKKLS